MANVRRPPREPASDTDRAMQGMVRTSSIRTITASETGTDADGTVKVDATGGAVTYTLPQAALMEERVVTVKKIDSSANAVTIAAAAGETIDGASTQVMTTQYEALAVHSDGTTWSIVFAWMPRAYGTFTPGISFGGGTTGITYSLQRGGYVKIGRLVIAMFAISLTNKGSSTGQMKFTGLPFTTDSVANSFAPIIVRASGMTGVSDHMQGITDVNATTATFEQFVAGASSNIDQTHVNNTSSWVIAVAYLTAA